MAILAEYLNEIRTIRDTGAHTAETSFYPPLDKLLKACGETLKPRVTCVLPLKSTGAGLPDGGFFPVSNRRSEQVPAPGQRPERGVLEAKPFGTNLEELARRSQVRKYLEAYQQVLITNFWQFRLLVLEDGAVRIVEEYELARSETAFHALTPGRVKEQEDVFPDFLRRVLLRRAPLTSAKDLAWLLASYAREARARAETHPLPAFAAVKTALEESLGITFEGEKGEHFFRSTLVQTLFYGIFSAWILWSRTEGRRPGARFNWRLATDYLRVPVLRQLFDSVELLAV